MVSSKRCFRCHAKLSDLPIKSILPDLSLIEKAILFIDVLQIFTIIWNISLAWSYSSVFLTLTRPLVLSSVDIFAFSSVIIGQTANIKNSLWGQMDGYLNYALDFAIASGVLWVIPLFMRLIGSARVIHVIDSIALVFCYLAYLPIGLAISRLFYCEYDMTVASDVLAVDPNVLCYSSSHIGIIAASVALCCPLIIGLPYVLLHRIQPLQIYIILWSDHEKHIQSIELKAMLGISNEYFSERYWLFSSFSMNTVYYYVAMCILKLVLLILFITSRDSFTTQSLLFWFAFALFYLYFGLIFRTFRQGMTYTCYMILMTLLLFNISFGVADAFETKNSLTSSIGEIYILLGINISVLPMIALVVFLGLVDTSGLSSYPPFQTLYRIQLHDSKGYEQILNWVDCMNKAQEIKEQYMLSMVEFHDVSEYKETLKKLKNCYFEAMNQRSIFSTILSDLLQEMFYIYRVIPAFTKKSFYNEEVEHIKEMTIKTRRVNYRNKATWELVKTAAITSSFMKKEKASSLVQRQSKTSFQQEEALRDLDLLASESDIYVDKVYHVMESSIEELQEDKAAILGLLDSWEIMLEDLSKLQHESSEKDSLLDEVEMCEMYRDDLQQRVAEIEQHLTLQHEEV